MLAVYGPTLQRIALVREALPRDAVFVGSCDWVTFERQSAGCDCAVALVDWLGDPVESRRLADFRRRRPLQPLVLLTHRDADNARHLKDLPVDEVVWREELRQALWPAVVRARSRGALHRVAHSLAGASRLPPVLRDGLAAACRDERGGYTVAGLADRLLCDRRTLWRHWREAVGESPLTLQDALQWLLLLRAASRKTRELPWRAVAEGLGVHEHTLGRLAQRLAGRPLRQLDHRRVPELLALFDRRVLRVLVGPRDDDARSAAC
jgi:hypothetical protein